MYINMKPHQFFASDPLLWRLQRPHGAQAKPRCESMAFGVLEFSGPVKDRHPVQIRGLFAGFMR